MIEATIKRGDKTFTLTQNEISYIINHPAEPFTLHRGLANYKLTDEEKADARYAGIHNHITGRFLGSFMLMPNQAEDAAKEVLVSYDISRFPADLEPLLYEKAQEKLSEMEAELPF